MNKTDIHATHRHREQDEQADGAQETLPQQEAMEHAVHGRDVDPTPAHS